MPISPTKLAAVTSDDRVTATQLLRFCSLAATRLGDQEMANWCRDELVGYEFKKIGGDHPYRSAPADLRGRDAYGRVLPAFLNNSPKIAKILSLVPIMQSVAEIETMLANAGRETHYEVSFQPEDAARLRKAFPGTVEVFRLVQANAFRAVLVAVRQRIFDWALDLAARSVSLPDDVSFADFFGAPPETVTGDAAAVATLGPSTVVHITGATHSPIQVAGGHSQQSAAVSMIDTAAAAKLVAGLLEVAQKHEPPEEQLTNVLRVELENLRAVLAAPRPKQEWLREGFKSVRNILEGAAGSALYEAAKAAGLVAAIGKLLGM